jgi:hypothetical protein
MAFVFCPGCWQREFGAERYGAPLGTLVLAFVVTYTAFWILRLLLTKPVPRR